jgi:hypothetical protein
MLARLPPDGSDVDGDVVPVAVEGLQVDDEVGGRECGVGAALGFDAGVSGLAGDDDAEVRDAFAADDEIAVLAGAFQAEGVVHAAGGALDEGAAGGRADLLVGSGEKDQLVIGGSPVLVEDLQCGQAGEQAALVVADAGAVGEGPLERERPCESGAAVEDGVHVPRQENPAAAIRGRQGALLARDQSVAGLVRAVGGEVHAFDGEPRPSQAPLHPVGDLVDAVGIVRSGVDGD